MKALSGILVACLVLAGAVFLLSPTPAEARFRTDDTGFTYSYNWRHTYGQQDQTTDDTSLPQDQTQSGGSGARGPYGLQDGTCDPQQPQDGTGFGYQGGR